MNNFFTEAARIYSGVKTIKESFTFQKNDSIVTAISKDRKESPYKGEAMDHSPTGGAIYGEGGISSGNRKVSEIIKSGSHPYRNIANAHAMSNNGKPLSAEPETHPSSIERQHAIGVVYGIAASEHPEYKKRVFDAYKTQRPEIVREARATNYDELLHASYNKLSGEVDKQFKDIPLKMHFRDDKFYDNSQEMMRDVHLHHAITVYSGGEHEQLGKPDENGLSTNLKFRAVHDVFGHSIHGNQFGPKGEEIAWDTHRQTLSPLSQLALTSETRGQNSYVNYTHVNLDNQEKLESLRKGKREFVNSNPGKSTEKFDRGMKNVQENWNYAPNKSVLLPPEMLHPKFSGEMPSYLHDLVRSHAEQPSDNDIQRIAKFHSTSSHSTSNGGVEDPVKKEKLVNMIKRNLGR